jgi:hypothetical protein
LVLVASFALMNQIKLLDESKNVVETLGIDKWNTDSVEAFFDERLKK